MLGNAALPLATTPAQGCGEEGAQAKSPLHRPSARQFMPKILQAARALPQGLYQSRALQLTGLIGGAKSPELQVLGELEEKQPGFPGTGDEASLRAEMGRLS